VTVLTAGAALPLLASQSGRWARRRQDPGDPMDNCGAVFRFTGPLRRDALERAVAQAYAETEALRVVFTERAGRVTQSVTPAGGPTPWTTTGLSSDDAATEHMRRLLAVPFSLSGGGPLCLHALIDTPDSTWFLFLYDHLTLDAYGVHRYLTRVTRLYDAFRHGRPAPPSSFAPLERLVEEERAYRDSPRARRDLAHWRTVLSAPIPSSGFTSLRAPAGARPLRVTRRVPDATRSAFRALSAASGARWPASVVTAMACELSRATGAGTVGIGLPVANRATPTAARTPVNAVKELPLRIDVGAAGTFAELLASVSRQITDGLMHQRAPLEQLPIPKLHTFVNVIVGEPPRFPGSHAEFRVLSAGPTSGFRVDCHGDAAREASLTFEANSRLYGRTEIQERADSFGALLHALLSDADAPLTDVCETAA